MQFDRRQFLAFSSVGLAGVAGCTGGGSSSDESGSTATPTGEATASGPGSAASVGETVTTENGIAMAITDAQLANDVMTPDGDLVPEEENHRLAVVRIEAQNTADEPRDLPTAREIAMVTGGTQFPAETEFGRTEKMFDEIALPASGPIYETIEQARPSVSTSGWLIFDVPENTASGRVSWSRTAYTDAGEITRGAEWDIEFDPESLPNLQVTRVDAPETAYHYEDASIVIEVENAGGAEGTFEGSIRSEELSSPVAISVRVAPGKSKTVAVTIPYPGFFDLDPGEPEEATYHLAGQQFQIRYQSPRLDAGETARFPNGVEAAISSIQRIRQFSYDGYLGETTVTPDAGFDLLAFQFDVTNQNDVAVSAPYAAAIDVENQSGAVIESYTTMGTAEQLRGGVSGPAYNGDGELAPGENRRGWIVLEVKANAVKSALVYGGPSGYPEFQPRWSI